jgi:hypothetical protein
MWIFHDISPCSLTIANSSISVGHPCSTSTVCSYTGNHSSTSFKKLVRSTGCLEGWMLEKLKKLYTNIDIIYIYRYYILYIYVYIYILRLWCCIWYKYSVNILLYYIYTYLNWYISYILYHITLYHISLFMNHISLYKIYNYISYIIVYICI